MTIDALACGFLSGSVSVFFQEGKKEYNMFTKQR